MRPVGLLTVLLLAAALCACAQAPDAGEAAAADEKAAAPDSSAADSEVLENGGEVADTTDVDDGSSAAGDSTNAADAQSGAASLRVLRAYVCKGIEESEPAEAGKSFLSPDDGILRLCCFSEVATAGADTIQHVWYWGDREMARVPLEVRPPRWRTWSTKRIMEAWRGDWHVDITSSGGSVLDRLEFSIE